MLNFGSRAARKAADFSSELCVTAEVCSNSILGGAADLESALRYFLSEPKSKTSGGVTCAAPQGADRNRLASLGLGAALAHPMGRTECPRAPAGAPAGARGPPKPSTRSGPGSAWRGRRRRRPGAARPRARCRAGSCDPMGWSRADARRAVGGFVLEFPFLCSPAARCRRGAEARAGVPRPGRPRVAPNQLLLGAASVSAAAPLPAGWPERIATEFA